MSQQSVKEAVVKMLEGVQAAPQTAQLTYKADVKWEGDVLCSSKVAGFPTVMVDEPPAFGGGNSAQGPADLLLTALGACQSIMYSALASSMDIKIDELSVKLAGDMNLKGLLGLGADEGIPPGFQNIRFETNLKSPASQEQLKQLVDAVEAQCPILDTMVRAIAVSGKANINGEEYVAKSTPAAAEAVA